MTELGGDMLGVKNFRDVGNSLNQILGAELFKSSILYRSGALDEISTQDNLPQLKTIVNLRREKDPDFRSINLLQVAPLDTMNNYIFESEIFKEWIQRLYNTLADETIWPSLLHCTSGKDRTGVGIALLLKNIGVSDDAIVKEYMLGDYGNRYPESMTHLLSEMPKFEHLKMKEPQIHTLKRVLFRK